MKPLNVPTLDKGQPLRAQQNQAFTPSMAMALFTTTVSTQSQAVFFVSFLLSVWDFVLFFFATKISLSGVFSPLPSLTFSCHPEGRTLKPRKRGKKKKN